MIMYLHKSAALPMGMRCTSVENPSEQIFPRLDLPYHEVGYWEAYGKAGPPVRHCSLGCSFLRFWTEVWQQVKEHAEQPE